MSDTESRNPEAPGDDGFLTPEVGTLTTYWQGLARRRGGVPLRSEFDPIAVPSLLSSLLIVERISAEAYKIRLQGTGFEGRGIEDWTGQIWVDDPLDPDNGPSFELFRQVLDTPCGLRIVGIEQSSSRRLVRFEAVGFPLADDDGTPRFIVVTVAPLETVGYETDHNKLRTLQSIESQQVLPVLSNPETIG
jgi:hypothetical protein